MRSHLQGHVCSVAPLVPIPAPPGAEPAATHSAGGDVRHGEVKELTRRRAVDE